MYIWLIGNSVENIIKLSLQMSKLLFTLICWNQFDIMHVTTIRSNFLKSIWSKSYLDRQHSSV